MHLDVLALKGVTQICDGCSRIHQETHGMNNSSFWCTRRNDPLYAFFSDSRPHHSITAAQVEAFWAPSCFLLDHTMLPSFNRAFLLLFPLVACRLYRTNSTRFHSFIASAVVPIDYRVRTVSINVFELWDIVYYVVRPRKPLKIYKRQSVSRKFAKISDASLD